MNAMEMYSHEIQMRVRNQEIIRAAEAGARLEGWQPPDGFAERLAMSLRRLADRLDGRQPTRISIFPG